MDKSTATTKLHSEQQITTNDEIILNNKSNTQSVLQFVETLTNEKNFTEINNQKIEATTETKLSSTNKNLNLFEQTTSVENVFVVNNTTSLSTVVAEMSTSASGISENSSSQQSTVASATNWNSSFNSLRTTTLSVNSNSQKSTNKDSAALLSTPRNTNPLPPKYSTPPSCSSEGVIYAAANCRQYYVCQKFLFFWVTAYLKTCNEGMGFKSIEMKCVPFSTSDCKIT